MATNPAGGSGASGASGTGPVAPDKNAGLDPRRWMVLGVVALAQLMVVLDATIVNIALPSAQEDLGFDDGDRQWVVTAYALAFGSLLLLGGRIADLAGRKRAFLAGLVGFATASAIGGASVSFEMLVAARALQGACGALLAPAALSLLTTTFTDPAERGKAFGIYGAVAGGGGAVGLLLGGILTEYLDWRWCLYVNLIFAVIALVAGARVLAPGAPADRNGLDIPGTLLASAGLFCIVYGFSNAEQHGWRDAGTWGCLLLGLAFLVGFVLWVRRAPHPLLPLRVVLDRNRGASYFAVFVAGAGMFGVFLFLTYFLQQSLRYSPVETGLAFLPMVAMMVATSVTAQNILVPRLGPRPVVPVGMALAAAAMAWLTALDLNSTYVPHVLLPLMLAGTGLGLVMAPAMAVATAAVRTEDAGVASAMVNTCQQIGGSIGIAVLNTLAASAATRYAQGKPPTPQTLAQAQLHSYDTAYWWSAGFFAVGAVVTVLLYRSGPPATKAPEGASWEAGRAAPERMPSV
ncbi:MFS transporter [Yinghuangia soli]|uniref:MFS transporter n=1 Tax=Yinghuangia soli TaxID=2908204 RepID=A0AA41PZC1_9ACTN|nr:MFS transporter [Yinghuangia soli]MCF2528713.1 MFS transporter [Yinghuangia soli]